MIANGASPAFVAANDAALHRLLEAEGPQQVAAAIECLIESAQPIMLEVIGYYSRRGQLASYDVDDVLSTVRARLLLKLRHMVETRTGEIAVFGAYVAGLTYNAVNDHFRARHPERAQMKKRLRELCASDRRFVLRQMNGATTCELTGHPAAPLRSAQSAMAQVVERLLRKSGGTLPINDVIASLLGGRGPNEVALAAAEKVADRAPTPLIQLEQKEDIERLWREIQLLRVEQRAALLLNLRGADASNVIALFILIGVASLPELATALGLAADELASLWNDLPLDDLTIAERLGLTRQQVINLRKSARERLSRRMRGHRGGGQ